MTPETPTKLLLQDDARVAVNQNARMARVERLERLFRNHDGRSGTTKLRALVTKYRMEETP